MLFINKPAALKDDMSQLLGSNDNTIEEIKSDCCKKEEQVQQ